LRQVLTSNTPDATFYTGNWAHDNTAAALTNVSTVGMSLTTTYSGAAAAATTNFVRGLEINATTGPSNTDSVSAVAGALIFGISAGSGAIGSINGITVQGAHGGSGAVGTLEGANLQVTGNSQVAAVTTINVLDINSLGLVSNFTGTTSNNGILIQDQGANAPVGSVSSALHINAQTNGGSAIVVAGGTSTFTGDASGGNILNLVTNTTYAAGGGYNSIQFMQQTDGSVVMYTVNDTTGNFSSYSADGFGVTGSGSIFPQFGTVVALTIQGDNNGSNIQDWYVGAGQLADYIDQYGNLIVAPPGSGGPTLPALKVTGATPFNAVTQMWVNPTFTPANPSFVCGRWRWGDH
jgi:hypothetical protein